MSRVTFRTSLTALLTVALAAISYLVWQSQSASDGEAAADQKSAASAAPAEGPPTQVTLPPEKFAAAGILSVAATRKIVQQTRTVPGRVDYNAQRRVELKAPVDAVVQDVLVKPGDAVTAGTRLALLVSSEVGTTRADVEKNVADVKIANQAVEWAEQIATNLDELLLAIRQGTKPREIEQEFQEKLLGEHRVHVYSTWLKYLLAEQLWSELQPMIEKGSVASQVARQRASERETAKAAFQAACEQSRFDAHQQREKARAARDYARRVLDVSRQQLRTLLGAFSEVEEAGDQAAGEGEQLTRFYLIAPFAGTVEQRSAAAAQRAAKGTLLFVVADTSNLWVSADIRERDSDALSLKEGATAVVRVPALGERVFPARVDFIGRAVSVETNAVPLIAVIESPESHLKPGMFAWVTLPLAATESALVIPAGALLTHEGRPFVFVETGERTYRRIDITIGARTLDWVAVKKGLKPGDRVVSQGTFLLKSELLLEPEDE